MLSFLQKWQLAVINSAGNCEIMVGDTSTTAVASFQYFNLDALRKAYSSRLVDCYLFLTITTSQQLCMSWSLFHRPCGENVGLLAPRIPKRHSSTARYYAA